MSLGTYGAHDHAFTLSISDPALKVRAERALATLSIDHTATSTYRMSREAANAWSVFFEQDLVGTRPTPDGALLLLHWHINQRVIDRVTQRWTTFHAAAACSPSGSGVLLAAPMESGKTTMVTGLLRRGWGYLTDEAAACDPDGTVHAYAKPLTIDRGAWPLFPELRPPNVGVGADSWLVPATATGAEIVPQAPLRLIIFPRYTPGQGTQHSLLSPSQAAWTLAQSTFAFGQHGARDVRQVAALARRVPAIELNVGNLEQGVHLIEDIESSLDVAA